MTEARCSDHPSSASVLRNSSETTSALCCLPHWIRCDLHIAATVPQTMLLPSPCILLSPTWKTRTPMWECCCGLQLRIQYHSACHTGCKAPDSRTEQISVQLDPGLSDRQKSGGQNGQQPLHLRWPSTLVLRRAASSAHSCTPCTHMTVQPHTAPTSSFNSLTTQWRIGLITDNDETAYRAEVSTVTKWCQENHLSLNIDKTKELVVDFRRQSREHTPITIDKTPVERVNSFKFLGVHITEDLTWSAHTDAVLKKSHQRLFFLRQLRKFGMSPSILRSFHTCTVESKALQRVVRTARHIVGGELPSLQDIYTRRCIRKARRIINESSHPSHRLFSLLPSGRRLRSIRSCTSRLRDSFFPEAIKLMNSQN